MMMMCQRGEGVDANNDEEQHKLTILSWNVNGFNRKRLKVFRHLRFLKADVVFLQETHMGPDQNYTTGSIKIQDLDCDYNMAVFTIFKGSSRGVAMFFKKSLECGGFKVDGDTKGRFLIITCWIWGHEFVFINVYNPNDEKIIFTEFNHVLSEITRSSHLIVGGDFNTVMDPDLDKTSNLKNRNHQMSTRALRSFLETWNLVDVWRRIYPELNTFTYFAKKSQSRLDYFFMQSHSLTHITACDIHQRPGNMFKGGFISDHAPLSIEIHTNEPKLQFNSLILNDETCAGQILSTIKHISSVQDRNKGDLWSGLKVRLQCVAAAFLNQRSRAEETGCLPPSRKPQETEPVEQEGGLCLELFRDAPRPLSSQILELLDDLHQAERHEDVQSTLSSVLAEPVSRKEILLAITSLSPSESPAKDGFTVQFYKQYACELTGLLQAYFNQMVDSKLLHDFVRQDNYDHTYSCSYSPLAHSRLFTVANADYNILAFILAKRLSEVINYILNPGQSKTQALVQDQISRFQSDEQIPMLLISLKVNLGSFKVPFLFKSLDSVNLPGRFTVVLKTLVAYRERSVEMNERCPLTPLLVGLMLLPFICSVNSCKSFLELGDHQKSVIDKDRALIFLSNTNEALGCFEKMLKDFIDTSGLAVDENNSQVFVTGSTSFSLLEGKLKLFQITRFGCL